MRAPGLCHCSGDQLTKGDKFLTGGGCLLDLLVCFSLAYQAPIFSQNICYNSNCTLQFDVQFKSINAQCECLLNCKPSLYSLLSHFQPEQAFTQLLLPWCRTVSRFISMTPPPTTKNTKTLGVTCSWWFRNPAENPILPTWRNQWISEPSTVPNSIHIWYIYILYY